MSAEWALLHLPWVCLGPLMAVDEFYFHRKRGLGKWESLGHPLDTLSVVLPFLLILWVPRGTSASWVFVGAAVFSCLFVTKDEGVHLRECPVLEQRLHALLFMVHPILFLSGWLWWGRMDVLQGDLPGALNAREWIQLQLLIMLGFGTYQLIAWRKSWWGSWRAEK